jgi:hypothetical protein
MLLPKAQHVGTDFHLTAPYVVPAEMAEKGQLQAYTGSRGPAGLHPAYSLIRAPGDGERCALSVWRLAAVSRRHRSPLARGDGDLPLLTAFKGAILARKMPESGEYRLKSEQRSHWAESAARRGAVMLRLTCVNVGRRAPR